MSINVQYSVFSISDNMLYERITQSVTVHSSVRTVSRSVEVGNPCRSLVIIISHQPALVICDPTKNCCLIMKKTILLHVGPQILYPKCPKPPPHTPPHPDRSVPAGKFFHLHPCQYYIYGRTQIVSVT